MRAASDGTAWIAGWSANTAGSIKVERYTNAGRSWTRFLRGGDEVRKLAVTGSGDALLAGSDAQQSGWVARLSSRHGDEVWRVSADSVYRACLAR